MLEETQIATPPVEGGAPESAPQATPPDSQESAQPQETGPSKVDASGQPTSSNPAERRKASDFYRERERTRKLETTISELQKAVEALSRPKSSAPEQPQVPQYLDPKVYWEDPIRALHQMREDLKKEIRAELDTAIPGKYNELRTSETRTQRMQEALELMFPKTGPEDKAAINERAMRDPERADRIVEITKENGLDIVGQTDPMKAAQLAIAMYEYEKLKAKVNAPIKPVNPNVISKKLVGASPSGSVNAGGKPMATLNEVRAERQKLDQELERNPNLRFDDAFKQRLEAVKKQYTVLFDELKKGA